MDKKVKIIKRGDKVIAKGEIFDVFSDRIFQELTTCRNLREFFSSCPFPYETKAELDAIPKAELDRLARANSLSRFQTWDEFTEQVAILHGKINLEK